MEPSIFTHKLKCEVFISDMKKQIYDVIIVGAGPAGLTAMIYAARYHLNAIILGENTGGWLNDAHKICNFPTYPEISGAEFVSKMADQLKNLGVSVENERILGIEIVKGMFNVKTSKGTYTGKNVILALGKNRKKLGLKNEEQFAGKGVSYCATCDAPLFRNKTVGVVGGGNAALSSALLLAKYADKIFIIYRGEKFIRAEPYLIEQAKSEKKISVLFGKEITGISGKNFLEEATLNNTEKMKLDGLFVEIGAEPDEVLIDNIGIDTDKDGYIIVDKEQRTNIKGLYATGDIVSKPLRQIVTACADGAVAAYSIYDDGLKNKV